MVEAAVVVALAIPTTSASSATHRPSTRGYLVGPRQVAIRNQPTGLCWTVGATLRPGAIPALFGVPSHAVRDAVLDLDTVWGHGLESLREQIAVQPDVDRALTVWECALRARCDPDADIRTRRARSRFTCYGQAARVVSRPLPPCGCDPPTSCRELNRIAGAPQGESASRAVRAVPGIHRHA